MRAPIKRSPNASAVHSGGSTAWQGRSRVGVGLLTAGMLLRLYWKRVRTQLVQEALAALGIAVGVALIFAVPIANTSVPASVRSLYHELAGKASLEVAARSPEGFSQSLVSKAGEAPGVFGAAGVLESRITLVGPRGQEALTLFGAEPAIAVIGGPLVQRVSLRELEGATPPQAAQAAGAGQLHGAHIPTIALPQGPANAIGAQAGQLLVVRTRGRSTLVLCARVLSSAVAGAASQSSVAIAPLSAVQAITGLAHRLMRIMAKPAKGQEALAARSLERVAGPTLNVRSSEAEVTLLEEATRSQSQAANVFTALSLVVGLLFAYNAMLLTLPARRRWISWLRDQGARRSELIGLVALEALALGLVASALGLLLGDLLSGAVFGEVPRYLTSGFPIGTQRVITATSLAVAVGGGLIATALAAAGPALATLRGRPLERPSESEQATLSLGLLAGPLGLALGGAALLVTIGVAIFAPTYGIVAVITLMLALGLLLPSIAPWLVKQSERLALRLRTTAAYAATLELRAAPTRATAVAAIGAVALTAIVSIGGAAEDLRRGVDKTIKNIAGKSTVVVSASSFAQNAFPEQTFPTAGPIARLHAVAGVLSVRELREAFLDARGHRLFVLVQPQQDPTPISPSQIIEGSATRIARLLRLGGWATLSATVAREWHLKIGEAFALPTPSGSAHFRLAGTTANFGWPPGALVIGPLEYERLWHTKSATVLNVRFQSSVKESRAVVLVRAALAGTGFMVTPGRLVERDIASTTSQALAQIEGISTLMLFAALLAVIAAMGGSIWQRRPRLWTLKRMGMRRSELVRAVYVETGVVMAIGCLAGAVSGLAGQPIATLYVRQSTGVPEAYAPAFALAAELFVAATLIAALASCALGYVLTRQGSRRRGSCAFAPTASAC